MEWRFQPGKVENLACSMRRKVSWGATRLRFMENVDRHPVWVVWTICRWESGEWHEYGCNVEEERLYSMKTSRTAVSIR